MSTAYHIASVVTSMLMTLIFQRSTVVRYGMERSLRSVQIMPHSINVGHGVIVPGKTRNMVFRVVNNLYVNKQALLTARVSACQAWKQGL